MIHSSIKALEQYLNSIKTKSPEHIETVKSNLEFIIHSSKKSEQNVERELKNIKMYYQAQLSQLSYQGNYLAVSAILISVIIGFLSAVYSSDEVFLKILLVLTFFTIWICLFFSLRNIVKGNKKNVTYTIIIQIIDELLETQSFN